MQDRNVPVVQWIGCLPPKEAMQVRFLPGAPKEKHRCAYHAGIEKIWERSTVHVRKDSCQGHRRVGLC